MQLCWKHSLTAIALVLATATGHGRAQAPAPAPAAPTPEQEYQRLLGLQRKEPAPVLPNADGVRAEDITFRSAILERPMRYRVLLPASYGHTHEYYPVLFLLHGYMNPYYEWDKQTSLARVLQERELDLVVVLPQFDNSFYVNAAGEPKDRYMSYFFRDLLPEIEARYRVRSEPPARAIGGVSMGGFGAVLWGLRFPRAFSFVAGVAGSLDVVRRADEWKTNLAPFDIEKVFGPAGSPTRAENDPQQLVTTVDPATLPPFWLFCGTGDFLFEENVAFVRAAAERALPITFVATPGQHEWAVWDAVLPQMLEAAAAALGVRAKSG